ncbi:amino acid transporter [Streptosporangium sp. NPDC051022]|uniref:amino acid transporter n=1 Tax=Streptosporangium sp. NPDC051022 TaxID=3155752 RepID=UPI0034302CF0
MATGLGGAGGGAGPYGARRARAAGRSAGRPVGRLTRRVSRRLSAWLLEDTASRRAEPKPPQGGHPWWRVMCLTGVDYFSTLGYQPGIAFLAAGALSPLATVVLVAVTLLGALPVYRRVAEESPHGQGSIALLQRYLPRWRGKLLVLVLLGFLATDFIITITLSSADATAHIIENPLVPEILRGHRIGVTLLLVSLLGAVFLRGFGEAIGIAVGLVGTYLALNLVVLVVAFQALLGEPRLVLSWKSVLAAQYPSTPVMVATALLVFPRLALGLSGFETGVAVMPLVKGLPDDDPERPEGRIHNTRHLLVTAASIMSVLLIASSLTTTLLIPAREFQPGGRANGRALAYLAHEYLGPAFGTAYDLSTITILWFAGASAMAGLLTVVPRYLPRYGMAPHWALARRPLVLVFTAVAFAITIIFRADVDAQGGAYATGVLVVILSAALAVTLSAHRRGDRRAAVTFGAITLLLVYTTAANILERPEGIKIASFFIGSIIVTSFASRATRSFELRVDEVILEPAARSFVEEAARSGQLLLVASNPAPRDHLSLREKERRARELHNLPRDVPVLLLEVTVTDASEFSSTLTVGGVERDGCRVLTVQSPSIANAIAALLLYLRDHTGRMPQIFFHWAEGNPVVAMLRYLVLGEGDVPPTTREILRKAEPHPERRPRIHIG